MSETDGYQRTYQSVVYPWQCDAMGHMTVQFYTAAFDQAMWNLVYNLGWRPEPDAKSQGFADVQHVTRFMKELAAGSPFYIESRPQSAGRSSLVTRHRMVCLLSGEPAADLDMTSVHFDLIARRSTPFADDFKTTLEASIARHITEPSRAQTDRG